MSSTSLFAPTPQRRETRDVPFRVLWFVPVAAVAFNLDYDAPFLFLLAASLFLHLAPRPTVQPRSVDEGFSLWHALSLRSTTIEYALAIALFRLAMAHRHDGIHIPDHAALWVAGPMLVTTLGAVIWTSSIASTIALLTGVVVTMVAPVPRQFTLLPFVELCLRLSIYLASVVLLDAYVDPTPVMSSENALQRRIEDALVRDRRRSQRILALTFWLLATSGVGALVCGAAVIFTSVVVHTDCFVRLRKPTEDADVKMMCWASDEND